MFAFVNPVKLLSEIIAPVCVVDPVTIKFPLTVKSLLTVTSLGKPIVSVSVALTATSTSFPVPATVRVSPPLIVCVVDPSLNVNDVLILAVLAAVIRPCASMVITGIAVLDP